MDFRESPRGRVGRARCAGPTNSYDWRLYIQTGRRNRRGKCKPASSMTLHEAVGRGGRGSSEAGTSVKPCGGGDERSSYKSWQFIARPCITLRGSSLYWSARQRCTLGKRRRNREAVEEGRTISPDGKESETGGCNCATDIHRRGSVPKKDGASDTCTDTF